MRAARIATAVIPAIVLSGAFSACVHQARSVHGGDTDDEQKRAPMNHREYSDVNAAAAQRSSAGPAQRGPADLLGNMGQDLADRLRVNRSELQVLSVEAVTWDDGALGCPQPGRAYTTARTPGLRVVFAYDGRMYQYHASDRGAFVYCPNAAATGERYDRR